MSLQNPTPRSRAELEAMLDARMMGDAVLKMLPNKAWDDFKTFNAGREARVAVGTVEMHNED